MKQSTARTKMGRKQGKQASLEIVTKFMYWEAKRNINPSRLKKYQNLEISNKQQLVCTVKSTSA